MNLPIKEKEKNIRHLIVQCGTFRVIVDFCFHIMVPNIEDFF